jgi:hypothetical protein
MEGRIESDPDRIAAMMIGFPEEHVLSVDEDEDGLWVEVETRDDTAQCPTCGTQATSHQTRGVDRQGLPVFRASTASVVESTRVVLSECNMPDWLMVARRSPDRGVRRSARTDHREQRPVGLPGVEEGSDPVFAEGMEAEGGPLSPG